MRNSVSEELCVRRLVDIQEEIRLLQSGGRYSSESYEDGTRKNEYHLRKGGGLQNEKVRRRRVLGVI